MAKKNTDRKKVSGKKNTAAGKKAKPKTKNAGKKSPASGKAVRKKNSTATKTQGRVAAKKKTRKSSVSSPVRKKKSAASKTRSTRSATTPADLTPALPRRQTIDTGSEETAGHEPPAVQEPVVFGDFILIQNGAFWFCMEQRADNSLIEHDRFKTKERALKHMRNEHT